MRAGLLIANAEAKGPYSADGVTEHPFGHKLSINSIKQGYETVLTNTKCHLFIFFYPCKSLRNEHSKSIQRSELFLNSTDSPHIADGRLRPA